MFGYAYDAAGNLLSEKRLATAGGATYIFGADGNRVEVQGVG